MIIQKGDWHYPVTSFVCVSGYFDPLHVGHIEYLEKAASYGHLLVIVNSDKQAIIKKGKPFMPAAERMRIVDALRCVDVVIEAVDEDGSVCETLRQLKPRYFAKGGDRFSGNIPELAVCKELGIELIDGEIRLNLLQSSSSLIAGAKNE